MDIIRSNRRGEDFDEFWPVRNNRIVRKENKDSLKTEKKIGGQKLNNEEGNFFATMGGARRKDLDFRRKRAFEQMSRTENLVIAKKERAKEMFGSGMVKKKVNFDLKNEMKNETETIKKEEKKAVLMKKEEDVKTVKSEKRNIFGTAIDKQKTKVDYGEMVKARQEKRTNFVGVNTIRTTQKMQSLPRVQAKNREMTQKMMPTAAELKRIAVEKALAEMNAQEKVEEKAIRQKVKNEKIKKVKKVEQESRLVTAMKKEKKKNKLKKVSLALACALSCVAVLAYFVHLNVPDISVKVAAIQAGINAKYPNYLPKGMRVVGVSATKETEVKMEFKGEGENGFLLLQTKSAWDSVALLDNHVRPKWKEDWTRIREQGITIYLTKQGAVWVNGGIMFEIVFNGQVLEPTQIKNIATSL